MAFTFEWDPRKAAANRRKHGVTFDEAATAFGDPFGIMVDDPRHSAGESRLVLLGHSQANRLLAVMFTERGDRMRLISARTATRRERHTMKKTSAKRTSRVDADDILPEYDFSRGRRNPYAARMAGGHIVVLEPDVAEVFPNASAVNEALRALAGIIRDQRARRPQTRKTQRRSRRGSA